MPKEADAMRALREALSHSPDNVPLRRHLAETLVSLGEFDEAEKEFRRVLQLAPNDTRAKLGLAEAYHARGRHHVALAVLEDLLSAPEATGAAHLLHARVLLKTGQVGAAVRAYRQAVETDPSLADDALAEALGVDAGIESAAEVVEGRVRALDGEAGDTLTELERPGLTFADVGGMDAVKEEIRMKIIYPLTNRDLYAAYGKPVGGGILMYGPPGCGKTYLARATAGEIRAGFLAVGLHDVLDMWIGQSERRLHEIFEQARRTRPCVLFFDEADALGASRSDMRHSGGRQIINQFLAELDGVQASNEGVLVLAATNAPWHLDPAFRRPGRFDRVLFIPPPDAPARAAILEILLKGKPLEKVDHAQVAAKSDGFSGADLKAVVDVTIEAKLREAMKRGVPQPIGTRDLLAAARGVKASTREWFATARNYALYSNQGGIYDDILHYLGLKK
ncbi:MAG: AAA family ATPase [Armatimonadetes bacterium]|nr:AAA family ATPase [Armatimonadota bacterium]